ncbi:MAG: YdeI/OmpD-associated family protein [Flavobacteriales bacterium]|nr:YdeI/OmpD-associated family protein [Flavobacteriales bacterium]MCB9194106.1 YdeI/OmpD-associated family protein [Flavobacteriales bacterium]
MIETERINNYIAEQDEWKRRLMVRLRQLIHQVDPAIDETWRWNGPHFDKNGIMLGMSAHKTCVSVWFHKGSLLKDPRRLFEPLDKDEEKGMRVYKLKEGVTIDEKGFSEMVKAAVKLNEEGVKLTEAKPPRKALVLPPELEAVLRKDDQAQDHWDRFTYTKKKDYIEWITDAKRDETRKRRIAQAFQLIRDGLGLNERYEKH